MTHLLSSRRIGLWLTIRAPSCVDIKQRSEVGPGLQDRFRRDRGCKSSIGRNDIRARAQGGCKIETIAASRPSRRIPASPRRMYRRRRSPTIAIFADQVCEIAGNVSAGCSCTRAVASRKIHTAEFQILFERWHDVRAWALRPCWPRAASEHGQLHGKHCGSVTAS